MAIVICKTCGFPMRVDFDSDGKIVAVYRVCRCSDDAP